jgi:hypothetical protein
VNHSVESSMDELTFNGYDITMMMMILAAAGNGWEGHQGKQMLS